MWIYLDSFPTFPLSPPSLHIPACPWSTTPRGVCSILWWDCARFVAAPASAPARPRPGPGTALICSHSSSRQSVKHWGKIFCLPEQLLINCPFIHVQDKFCLLSLPLLSSAVLPLPPYLPTLVLTFTMFTCSGAPSLPVVQWNWHTHSTSQ